MSRSLNKVMLIGNVGSDPEIRSTGSGARVAQFSLATNRRWTNQAGEQQEKTEWHRVVVWERLADVVERYVKKGQQVYVEGSIEYSSYEAKDGSGTRYTTEIRGRELILLGGREAGANEVGAGRERPMARAGGAPEKTGGREYDDFQPPAYSDQDDDLPF